MKKFVLSGLLTALICSMGLMFWSMASAGNGVISKGVFIGDKDVSGMTVEEAEAYVKGKVQELGGSVITLKMGDHMVSHTWNELGLTWENKDLIQEISQLGTTGNIVRRYKEKKDLQNESSHFDIELSLDENAERSFVESCRAFNSEPVEGKCYMGEDGQLYVEGGTDGLTLNEEATFNMLKDYLGGWEAQDQLLEVVYDRASPVLTAEMLSQMTDVLGTATTDYSSSSYARAKNVETGTSKVNGTLLMPGEGFSVTSAVVPFTAENGYELAPSYEAGQVVDSYGGGICQVSTTLYNAVLKAELEVDQRSNHTMIVTYVDPSKDAAIAEGTMDFCFTNDTDYPIYIAGSAYYGTLNFTIFGVETRPSNRTLEFVSKTTGETDPSENVTLVAKTDQPFGYFNQTSTPHQGLSAELWKNIYEDGVLVDSVQINSSYYQATAAIYEVGVMTDNATLASALYNAIGQNSLEQVQYLLTYGVQQQTQQTQQTTDQQVQQAPVQQEQVQQAPVQQEQVQQEPQQDVSQLTDPPEEEILIQ